MNDTDNKMETSIYSLNDALKRQGFNGQERVSKLLDLFEILEPAIKESVEGYRREFEENPSIGREYIPDYKLIYFIPLTGLFIHEKRNERKKEKNHLFFRWANDRESFDWAFLYGKYGYNYDFYKNDRLVNFRRHFFMSNLKEKAYNAYSWMTFPATAACAIMIHETLSK